MVCGADHCCMDCIVGKCTDGHCMPSHAWPPMNQCGVCIFFIMDTCCTLQNTKSSPFASAFLASCTSVLHSSSNQFHHPCLQCGHSCKLKQTLWCSKCHLFNVTFKHGELVMVCCQVKLWHFQGVEESH